MNFKFSKRISGVKASAIREILKMMNDPEIISFGGGNPASETFPITKLKEISDDIFSNQANTILEYGITEGDIDFKKAALKFLSRHETVLKDYDEVMVTSGSQQIMDFMSKCLCDEGDIVMIPSPSYPVFANGPKIAGAEIYEMPMREEHEYLIQFDEIPKDIASKAKMMIISYPNNPTGATAPDAFYEELIRFAKANDIIVLHDTAYSNLVFDGEEGRSFLYYEGAKDIGIEFNSFSKTYGMAGARIGICVGNKEIVGMLRKLKSNIDYGMFLPIQKAAITALTQDQSVVEETREQYQKRRDMLVEGFHKAGWEVASPKGTMFMWAAIPKTYANSEQFAIALLQKTGILVTPGSAFGTYGEGFVRIALVQSEEVIEKALQAVQKSGFFTS